MSSFRKRLIVAGCVIVLVLLVVYGAYQAREYLRGPRITIVQAVKDGPLLRLEGTALRIAFLSLQGKQIFTDENGHWQETLLLLPGYNIVSIVARDRFGRTTEKHQDAYRADETIY